MTQLERCLPLLLAGAMTAFAGATQAQGLAQVPLFLAPAINPNVLVMFDNSQSMDAAMGGKMLTGSDPATRSNVARGVLLDIIGSYRFSFNWGLGSFGISGAPAPYSTFAYFLGNPDTMVYTNTCTGIVDGVGESDIVGLHAVVVDGVKTEVTGPLPCIANPEPANGFGFITFDRSGDDADVNDVTYSSATYAQMYGIGSGDTRYRVWGQRTTDPSRSGIGWAARDFDIETFVGGLEFLPTDSGWVVDAVASPRRLWTARGWGFDNPITGEGAINEPVVKSLATTTSEVVVEATHFDRLKGLLAPEDADPASASIKNAARYTPLAGSVETSRKYFEGSLDGRRSPIDQTCQSNFVVLATDGNPTGKKDGSQYTPSDWVNTSCDPETWVCSSYGPAIEDVVTQIGFLRETKKKEGDETVYDIPTYVIGMGSTVLNPNSIASLHAMARAGGTKTAFLAGDADALKTAFQTVATEIKAKTSSAASVSVNTGFWRADAALYQGTFSSVDWSGDLLAIAVGEDGVLASTPTWSAAERLKASDWDSGRAIVTYKPSAILGSRGVALRWPAHPVSPTATELDSGQILALNKDGAGRVDGLGEQRLRYLRGDTSEEARSCAGCTFRNRPATVLGDIIDSAPFYVGAPVANYAEDFESVPYTTFAAAWRTRAPHLYVGANDGMLHAFDAATGDESFAYVPNLVFNALSGLTEIPFTHRYNVDGTPAVGDVFYDGAWHTLLVAGLRAGGRGLYALDVTDPASVTEAGAASIARWEFTDADMGHVFTPPMLVKTNNGRWSVITGNGYENAGSGRAVLYVIDAERGDVVAQIDAGTESVESGRTSPNGLSGPAAIDINGDGVVDVVYAGDLNGKLWKFDLTAASPAAWGLAVGGEALFDAGAGKPITSRPDVTRSPKGGFLVTFGTGRYMSSGDPASTAPQTAFGVWDRDGTVVTMAKLQQQLIESVTAAVGSDTYRLSTHRVGTPTDSVIPNDAPSITPDVFYRDYRGWYIDLPTAGERIVADARIRGGRAIFTSIIPADGACESGGTGWILEFDVFTGNRLDSATFDVDSNPTLDSGDFVTFVGVSPEGGKNNTSGWKIGAVPAGPAFMGFKNGTANSEIKFVNTSDGNVVQKREAAGSGGEGRVMWRVVQ